MAATGKAKLRLVEYTDDRHFAVAAGNENVGEYPTNNTF
jgi:hypothetical protein